MDGYTCRRRAIGAGSGLAGTYRTHQATGRALHHAPAETHRGGAISCCSCKFTPQEDGCNMAMKPSYKQTDVGNIPIEWNAPVLGGLFDFKNGLNKGKEYFGHGTPIVNYMDVYRNCGLYAHDLLGRVDVSKQELKAFEVKKGDVFFTRTSETVEEVGIASVMLNESPDTVFSGFVLRARPKNDNLDDQFKKYCFSPFVVRKQITSKSTYTTRALTNGRLLSAVAIAC